MAVLPRDFPAGRFLLGRIVAPETFAIGRANSGDKKLKKI